MSEPRSPFFQVLSNLQEGDLVLFRTDRTVSSLQRLVCNSAYDHLGVIVAWPFCSDSCCSPRLKAARESAGTKPWHTLEASADGGVQLHRFTPACLNAYPGHAFVRHLDLSNLTRAQYSLSCAKLHRFVKAILGAPYESSLSKMIQAADLLDMQSKQSLDDGECVNLEDHLLLNPFEMEKLERSRLPKVFCSQLVAAALMVMGFIRHDERGPDKFIPRDFSSGAKVHRMPTFRMGVSLQPEMRIDHTNLSTDFAAHSFKSSSGSELASESSEESSEESEDDVDGKMHVQGWTSTQETSHVTQTILQEIGGEGEQKQQLIWKRNRVITAKEKQTTVVELKSSFTFFL